MATDVLGRVVEVVSGQSLDAFLAERVLGPLGMTDTAFHAAPEHHDRLAALYAPDPATGRASRFDAMGRPRCSPPDALSGGGGLVSTAADYHRFALMLLGGGELDGVRLLGPRTCATWRATTCPAASTSRRSAARCSPRRRSRASASGSGSPS